MYRETFNEFVIRLGSTLQNKMKGNLCSFECHTVDLILFVLSRNFYVFFSLLFGVYVGKVKNTMVLPTEAK